MKRSAEEKATLRAQFRAMPLREKLDYIITYYKLELVLALLVLVAVCSIGRRVLFPVEPMLYVGCVNVTLGSDSEAALTTDFVAAQGGNSARTPVELYTGLYLSADPSAENHQYAYASRMKVMASINSKKLDVVLMNREAYDAFSANGYLLDLAAQPEWAVQFAPLLTENDVVLEDNEVDYLLGEAAAHEMTTETAVNALALRDTAFFARCGFTDEVYLGVLANTPRPETCLQYAAQLCG